MADETKETAEEKALRESVEALKAKSNRLSESKQRIAELRRQQIAELKRLDEEGEQALGQFVIMKEAEAYEKLSPEQRARTTILAVYDWPTHKRTATFDGDVIDIESGRGYIIVTALDRDTAINALKSSTKIGEGGLSLYDNSEEAVRRGLLKAALSPDQSTIMQIVNESFPLAAAAYRKAVELSGAFASATSGKSKS
jgi:hypothetical protein